MCFFYKLRYFGFAGISLPAYLFTKLAEISPVCVNNIIKLNIYVRVGDVN
jgi:hypothetical protein